VTTYKLPFPIFNTHEGAFCFNCYADLDGDWWRTAYPRGRYKQYCHKCKEATFYDLESEISEEMETS
jgi:hypothetical protein